MCFWLPKNGSSLTKKDISEVKEFFSRAVRIGAPLELIEVPWISQNFTTDLRLTRGILRTYTMAHLLLLHGEKRSLIESW
jgi:hypothetical protein